MAWTFSSFGQHGEPTQVGRCRWCGRKLRPKWRYETAPFVQEWVPAQPPHYRGRAVGEGPRVKVGAPRLGDYGDGHFCGLRCGRDFGLWHAEHGNFLVPAKKKAAG